MKNLVNKLFPSNNITCVEINLLDESQLMRVRGEVSRHGPYLIRVDIKFEAASCEKLVKFIHHLVRSLHHQIYNSYDSCPGSFQGHLIVQDPARNGAFPGGEYLIQMWVKDHPLFHGDEHNESTEVAMSIFEGGVQNAFDEIDRGPELWHDGIGVYVDVFEAPNCWLSYQEEVAAVGYQVGMHAYFVGPDLFEVCPMEPLTILMEQEMPSALLH